MIKVDIKNQTVTSIFETDGVYFCYIGDCVLSAVLDRVNPTARYQSFRKGTISTHTGEEETALSHT
jgi:hypothetical protein